MKVQSAKLNRKQEQAVAALLTHPTIAQAAKSIGIGETTLLRWLEDDGFRQAYQSARRECVEAAVGLLQKASGSAVAVLVSVMADTAKPGSVRISAARSVLDFAFKGAELLDMEVRLAALEEAAAAQD